MAGIGLYGGDPVGNIAVTEQGLDAVPTTTGEYLAAKLAQGFAANPTPRSIRSIERLAAETGMLPVSDEYGNPVTIAPEPPLEAEAANTEFGIPGVLKFDKPTPRSVAQDLYDHHRAELLRQSVINRNEGGIATGALGLGANLFAGTMDPLNLAVGFIPGLGEARAAEVAASVLGRAAETATITRALPETAGRAALMAMGPVERAALRVGLGGAQGAAAMAALQPIEYALSRGEQEDYTMAQALRSIALGTLIGGGLHATIGAGIDRVTGRYPNPFAQALEDAGPDVRQGVLQGSLGQMIDGRPVDTTAVLPLADAYRVREAGPVIDDPLALFERGELTAARAAEIASLSPENPAMWQVVADNLGKAEASRDGGVAVVADQLGYLPEGGVLKSSSEREAGAVIGRALAVEAERGGDGARMLDDAVAARYGDEPPAWVAEWKAPLLEAAARPVGELPAMRAAEPRLPGRAPAAGEPGGPRSLDTLAEINAHADDLERLRQPGRLVAPELQAEAQAAADAVALAEAHASALERAAFCIMRG